MPYTVELNEETLFVRVTHTGDTTIRDMQEARDAASYYLKARKWKRVLADVRKANLLFLQFEHFEFLRALTSALPKGTRIAVIAHPDIHLDHTLYAQNVAVQWDVPLRTFFDQNEAIAWLAPKVS